MSSVTQNCFPIKNFADWLDFVARVESHYLIWIHYQGKATITLIMLVSGGSSTPWAMSVITLLFIWMIELTKGFVMTCNAKDMSEVPWRYQLKWIVNHIRQLCVMALRSCLMASIWYHQNFRQVTCEVTLFKLHDSYRTTK